ncbi:MAG: GWxTD domain-containing protein [Bacillota bacterium]
MKAVVLILLILVTVPLFAQTENSNKQNPAGFLPNFHFDAYNYQSTQPGKTRMDIYVEVPFEGIQFLKTGAGFAATYNVTVSVFDESKEKLQTEKTWTETVNSQNFESTTSKKNFNLSLKSFDLAPANYFLRVEVEDKDSKKNAIKESMFTVRNLASTQISISDLLLISRQMIIDGNRKMIPNISRNVSTNKEGLPVYYEIYSDTASNVTAEYIIKDGKDKNIFSKSETNLLNKGTNSINYTINVPELNMGDYSLFVDLKDNSGNVITQTQKKFISRWVGVPSTITDLDKAVDEMVYIAKSDELDKIKDASNKEEKLKLYLDFWKSKDPSPNSEENEVFEEYYRRVSYANEHFKNYLEGWRSDMGMVFITLGPPNNVERYPYEIDSKPYEVWDYYDINKRFVFVDQTGFGDYRLINPVYGSWWKYRQ